MDEGLSIGYWLSINFCVSFDSWFPEEVLLGFRRFFFVQRRPRQTHAHL
jgi:hypothetical protein